MADKGEPYGRGTHAVSALWIDGPVRTPIAKEQKARRTSICCIRTSRRAGALSDALAAGVYQPRGARRTGELTRGQVDGSVHCGWLARGFGRGLKGEGGAAMDTSVGMAGTRLARTCSARPRGTQSCCWATRLATGSWSRYDWAARAGVRAVRKSAAEQVPALRACESGIAHGGRAQVWAQRGCGPRCGARLRSAHSRIRARLGHIRAREVDTVEAVWFRECKRCNTASGTSLSSSAAVKEQQQRRATRAPNPGDEAVKVSRRSLVRVVCCPKDKAVREAKRSTGDCA